MHHALARTLALALSFAIVSCASAPEIHGSPEAIVGGTVDSGDPNVYFLLIRGAGSCTAELISPHVVLTARHCLVDEATDAMIPARQLRLYVGRDFSSFVHSYTPVSTHIIPMSGPGFIGAEDLGLIVLGEPAAETPLTISRQDYRMMNGMAFTAIGYGQIPSGSAGRKYRAMGTVTSTTGGYLHVNNVICQGDSGGPMIGPDGNVWGVVSYGMGTAPGMMPDCGTSTGAYNSLFAELPWIDSILELAGDICISRPEVCDGVDNDCNGTADEGCLALGETCPDAAHCTSGHCEATSAGMICTTSCDATRSQCDTDFHCEHSTGCTGFCVPGAGGTVGIGGACTSDGQCEAGGCIDPGDGRQRCLPLCYGDTGQCASGEVCTASDRGCGSCVPNAIFGSPRGLGEECALDTQCRSGHCIVRAGLGECAVTCDSATGRCADGFVCQAFGENLLCVLDHSQPPGGTCHDTTDCLGGVCVAEGARGWCTPADCTGTTCPMGFACTMVGDQHVCTPMLALAGESCSADTGCASGLCYMGACSATCDEANDCGAGMRCVRSAAGTDAHCVLPPAPPQSGGCSVSTRSSSSLGLLLLIALGLLARRR
jgi:MYXO-CTERM domain-containing protein